MGRTNIVIDDALVREGMRLAGVKSIRELVDRSLREFVERRRRLAMLELRGFGDWDGDLGQLRGDNESGNH